MNAPIDQQCICKKRLLRFLRGSKCSKLTYTNEAYCHLVRGGSDAHWSGDVNDRKSTTGYYFKLNGQLGCQEAGHGCFFFLRSRIPGVGSRSSGSIVSEKTSGGFPHSTKTSSSNWRGQPELYKIAPKPSHSQEHT